MSARSLVVLLLGEYVWPAGGDLRARTAVEALGLLGVGETAARQAVRRLAAEDWLEPTGTRGCWRIGAEGQRVLAESKPRFGRASRVAPSWDEHWLLVRTTVPEQRRELRHQLRTALGFQGFGSLGGGWWISADRSAEDRAKAVLERLGIAEATSFVATSGALGPSPAALVAEVWNLSEARSRFDKLIGEFSHAAPSTDTETFIAYTQLVDAWRRALAVDPQLPAELLPTDWPGHAAQALLNERYARWHPTAAAWWAAR